MFGVNAQLSFLAVVHLSLNRANPTRRSNAESCDWAHCNSATLHNLNNLPSVEYDRCELGNTLNQLSPAYEQLPRHSNN